MISPYIAFRYLFARKSHNVINLISATSAVGMALGTAALVLILSVYNGFDSIIKSNLSDISPDLMVVSAEGKHFIPDSATLDAISSNPSVGNFCRIIGENVFASCSGKEALVRAKGVEDAYLEQTPLSSHILKGDFSIHDGDAPGCVVGAILSHELGLSPNFVEPVSLWFPKRGEKISMADPMASLRTVYAFPTGTFSINAEIDADLMILPLETMRELLGYDDEITSIEIRLKAGEDEAKAAKTLSAALGKDLKVLTRAQQNPSLYRMMRYEKAAIALILFFLVLIVALNIYGSLSMLRIEKREDVGTLEAMGATRRIVRRIFILEGWMISLLGMAAGLVLGVVLALLQQHFGLVKMPGVFITEAYPVVLRYTDILLAAAGVASIGLLVSLASSRSATE